jgi:hypothetical protein
MAATTSRESKRCGMLNGCNCPTGGAAQRFPTPEPVDHTHHHLCCHVLSLRGGQVGAIQQVLQLLQGTCLGQPIGKEHRVPGGQGTSIVGNSMQTEVKWNRVSSSGPGMKTHAACVTLCDANPV